MRRFEAGGHPSPDMQFAADCMRLGIVMKAHFGVPCGHIKPDGSILWPDERGEELNNVKIYIHRSFRYTLDGRSLRFKEGETYDFPEEEARKIKGWVVHYRSEAG